MLENPQASGWYSLPWRSCKKANSDNPSSDADNQQGSPLFIELPQSVDMTPQRLHANASDLVSCVELQAYLQGALHDGTLNSQHRTARFSQKGADWLERLSFILSSLGHKSWLYREGRTRDVYVLETSAKFLDVKFHPDSLSTEEERIAFVRGYFDAEGGIPRLPHVRFYIQFTQKNFEELNKVKQILVDTGIACGKLHNPSSAVDPDYWRFYVRAKSYRDFSIIIGSWHPRKEILLQRMMI